MNSYNKHSYIRLFVIFMAALSFTGCATQKQWQYTSEQESVNQIRINKSVSVPPLLDNRLSENHNMIGMYLIPLMPFGWQELNVPEGFQGHITSAAWLWKPNEDIAKSVAEELNKSHLFKEVFFTNKASDGDIVLEGAIKSTKYNGKILSYGLSIEGPLLWFIGFPSGTFNNELILNFKLKDKKNNAVLWEKDYKQSISNTSWIYHMPSDFEYSSMLKTILLQVIKDIQSNAESINNKLR
ncbi:MAG: hypothetical protein WAW61_15055 [Methylococcaceae bacterium]